MTRLDRVVLIVSVAMLVGIGILAAAAPIATPFGPDDIDLANRRAAPSLLHWFGTDDLGRDVLTRTLYGARVSLAIGLLSATVTAFVGILFGALAGYTRGWVDGMLMRITDALLAVPRLPLLMLAAAIVNPTVPVLILFVGLVGWMETARVVRSELLSLREQDFALAAHATGAAPARVVLRHLLPNVLPRASVATTLAVGRGILLESAMSFFGVGVQPPQASWGNMLYQAQSTMATEPWVALFPGLFIFATVLCVNLIGQELSAERARRG